jgi:hypothetical protein
LITEDLHRQNVAAVSAVIASKAFLHDLSGRLLFAHQVDTFNNALKTEKATVATKVISVHSE